MLCDKYSLIGDRYMTQDEEFLKALGEIGLSFELSEEINDIRKAVYDEIDEEEEYSKYLDNEVKLVFRPVRDYDDVYKYDRMAILGGKLKDMFGTEDCMAVAGEELPSGVFSTYVKVVGCDKKCILYRTGNVYRTGNDNGGIGVIFMEDDDSEDAREMRSRGKPLSPYALEP